MGNKKIATKRWQQGLRTEGEVVSHNVGRPLGAELRVCLIFPAFIISSLDLRATFVFFQWS